MASPLSPIDRLVFARLARDYHRRWRVRLLATDPAGRVILSTARWRDDGPDSQRLRRLAIDEALRWGESTLTTSPDGQRLCWAVPLMVNAQVTGGLTAWAREASLLGPTGQFRVDLPQAAADLRHLGEKHNLTNAALLDARRAQYERERLRAQAIHQFKENAYYNLRGLYLVNEPELLAAIRRGDRGRAREILNQQLVAVLHYAGDRMDLVKSFFMELVITMCRSAVEAGGAPQELLGANYTHITELAGMSSHEQLAPWLARMLESIMDAIARHRARAPAAVLVAALEYMDQHLQRDLSRDDVARAVHLSPSYFSRLFRRHLGLSFTHVLNQKRVDRAAELLARTEMSIKAIALEAGFADQSYLTKVFRRHSGQTPHQYRHGQRAYA